MIRKDSINHSRMNKDIIHWRGHEILRIEAFSDAVFAFAVTLLVISLEVPKNFDELLHLFSELPAFAISFVLLFQVWSYQNLFFRRYGLQDLRTVVLNGTLLFMVLAFVYPLKFLFTLVTTGNEYTEHGETAHKILQQQVPQLMIMYSSGFCAIFLVFALLYNNARKKAADINLTPVETFETVTHIYRNLSFVCIGALAIIICLLFPVHAAFTGPMYALLGIPIAIISARRGRLRRKKFGEGA